MAAAAGMSSDDIESFLLHTRCSRKPRVLASNELDTGNVPMLKGQILIVNTDVSSGPGIHWVLFYVSSNNTLNYFDPLGECSLEYGKFKKFASLYDKLISNQGFPTQHDSSTKFSNSCAMHTLFVAHLLCDYPERFRTLRDVMKVFKIPHSQDDITENECMVLMYLNKKFIKYSSIFNNLRGCY
jgi:hypothetical protein